MENREKPAAGSHINGWTTIARYLKIRSRNQSDLARKLQVSPAAISQIKNGNFRLNSSQLGTIVSYLEIDEEGLNDLYTELFAGRMTDHNSRSPEEDAWEFRCVARRRSSPESGIPVGDLQILDGFCPAVEPLNCFIRRHSPERVPHVPGDNTCAIRIPDEQNNRELPPGTTLVLADRYPEPGELVLARCGNGEYLLREFQLRPDTVYLRTPDRSAGETIWDFRDNPLWISWMRPVLRMEETSHA